MDFHRSHGHPDSSWRGVCLGVWRDNSGSFLGLWAYTENEAERSSDTASNFLFYIPRRVAANRYPQVPQLQTPDKLDLFGLSYSTGCISRTTPSSKRASMHAVSGMSADIDTYYRLPSPGGPAGVRAGSGRGQAAMALS